MKSRLQETELKPKKEANVTKRKCLYLWPSDSAFEINIETEIRKTRTTMIKQFETLHFQTV